MKIKNLISARRLILWSHGEKTVKPALEFKDEIICVFHKYDGTTVCRKINRITYDGANNTLGHFYKEQQVELIYERQQHD